MYTLITVTSLCNNLSILKNKQDVRNIVHVQDASRLRNKIGEKKVCLIHRRIRYITNEEFTPTLSSYCCTTCRHKIQVFL